MKHEKRRFFPRCKKGIHPRRAALRFFVSASFAYFSPPMDWLRRSSTVPDSTSAKVTRHLSRVIPHWDWMWKSTRHHWISMRPAWRSVCKRFRSIQRKLTWYGNNFFYFSSALYCPAVFGHFSPAPVKPIGRYKSNKPIKSKLTYRQSINQPKGLQWNPRLISRFNAPSEKLPHGDDFRVGPKSDRTPRDKTVYFVL